MKYGMTIAASIEKLAKEKGTKKTKLGEVLGAAAHTSAQWKYIKFDNFIKNLRKSKVNLQDLEKIAKFLGKDAEWFFREQKEGLTVPIDNRNSHIVPLLGMVSSAKEEWSKDDAQDWLAYPFDTAKSCKTFALTVENDNMEPNIKAKDIVFVDPQKPQNLNGKIIIARISGKKGAIMGRFLIREDDKIELKCDNPSKSGIISDLSQIEIIGVVKHKLSKI